MHFITEMTEEQITARINEIYSEIAGIECSSYTPIMKDNLIGDLRHELGVLIQARNRLHGAE